MRKFIVVKCEFENGSGCGARWLEGGERASCLYWCPQCGGRTDDGYIMVNDEDAPRVDKLDDERVLVVFEEEGV